MKRITLITSLILLVVLSSVALYGCATTSFSSITHIKSFDKISRITIVHNNYIVDGHVSGATIKDYREEKDILAIFNALNGADYRQDEIADGSVSEFALRIYVKGCNGYIEYNWDKSFSASEDFNGKLKEGSYSMDNADVILKEIKKIYYRD